jgi:CBS domain-containing protein
MIENKIAGLPVVDSGSAVIGIVTESDLFKILVAILREAEENPAGK